MSAFDNAILEREVGVEQRTTFEIWLKPLCKGLRPTKLWECGHMEHAQKTVKFAAEEIKGQLVIVEETFVRKVVAA